MDMEGTSKLKIFTGTAHPALAKEISDYIGVPLGKSLCGRFNNGEIQVMINESVRGKDCFIIQPTGAPVNDNLMEMLIMVDALKRASAVKIALSSNRPEHLSMIILWRCSLWLMHLKERQPVILQL